MEEPLSNRFTQSRWSIVEGSPRGNRGNGGMPPLPRHAAMGWDLVAGKRQEPQKRRRFRRYENAAS